MNLETVLFAFTVLTAPGLLAALFLLFTAVPGNSRRKKVIVRISCATAIAVGMVMLVVNTASLFWGNFLFFISGPVMALMFGGGAGVIVFVALALLYYMPACLLERRQASPPGQPAEQIRFGRLAAAVAIFIALSAGTVLKQKETELQAKYGSPSEGAEAPLTTEEIREAYASTIVRNHNYLLRGLLFRNNVPADILEDIYRRKGTGDETLLSMILMHPNTPCPLMHDAFAKITRPENFGYEAYRKKCPQ